MNKLAGIQMYANLCDPNKAAVVDSHLLPLTEDILSEFKELCNIFTTGFKEFL